MKRFIVIFLIALAQVSIDGGFNRLETDSLNGKSMNLRGSLSSGNSESRLEKAFKYFYINEEQSTEMRVKGEEAPELGLSAGKIYGLKKISIAIDESRHYSY